MAQAGGHRDWHIPGWALFLFFALAATLTLIVGILAAQEAIPTSDPFLVLGLVGLPMLLLGLLVLAAGQVWDLNSLKPGEPVRRGARRLRLSLRRSRRHPNREFVKCHACATLLLDPAQDYCHSCGEQTKGEPRLAPVRSSSNAARGRLVGRMPLGADAIAFGLYALAGFLIFLAVYEADVWGFRTRENGTLVLWVLYAMYLVLVGLFLASFGFMRRSRRVDRPKQVRARPVEPDILVAPRRPSPAGAGPTGLGISSAVLGCGALAVEATLVGVFTFLGPIAALALVYGFFFAVPLAAVGAVLGLADRSGQRTGSGLGVVGITASAIVLVLFAMWVIFGLWFQAILWEDVLS